MTPNEYRLTAFGTRLRHRHPPTSPWRQQAEPAVRLPLDRVRLEHILTAIDNIFQYTEGKTIQQFNDDTMLFYATVKNIEIIGEAAYHLTRTFCKEHPQTPWKDVMLMPNILVHHYYKIRLNEVWKVVKEDFQQLREQVARYIAETDWEEWGEERGRSRGVRRPQEHGADRPTHETARL